MMTPNFFKLILFSLCLSYFSSYAQTYQVSGFISTNDVLPARGATIRVLELQKDVSSDSAGFYQLRLLKGDYTFLIMLTGMDCLISKVKVSTDHRLNFSLKEKTQKLDEVVISAANPTRNLDETVIGIERMNMNTVKNIPLIFGEKDIFKAIQLLPGIKSAGEGSSGIFVRGGSADQNLILMDDVPIYNAAHLMGFFSTFNPDVVKDITVYKAGMPAQYGGHLSSILDVKTSGGNASKFTAKGDIGLISSKLTFNGPIQKGRSSFLVSGRRTYIDALLKLSTDKSISENTLYFYDFNAKLDFVLSAKTKLVLSGYFGNDKLSLSNVFGINWGNNLASAQLNHVFSERLNTTTTVAFSKYHNQINLATSTDNIGFYSQINDISFKQEFRLLSNTSHYLKFGVNATYHQVSPGELAITGPANYNPVNYQDKFSLENAAFISNDWKINTELAFSAGLRLSAFNVLGEGDFLNLDKDGNLVNTTTYHKGEIVKTYLNLEPRLILNYTIDTKKSIKTSYERNAQNMHMISNSTSSRPTDKWLSSSNNIKPEIADQFSIGYYQNLNHKLEFTAESYYKNMQNQIDYKDGANLFKADAIETQLLYGRGRAYGLELSLKKTEGNFSGWINYTIAKTERKIKGINNDRWYSVRQDRTHDIAIVGMYKVNKKLSISSTWIYYTGDAITSPSGKYNLDGQSFFYYKNRNAYRMPDYHRLDLGANILLKQKKNFISDLSLSLYNVYGRKNTYSITFREAVHHSDQTEAVRTSLFQFLPSISYSFKFI